MIRQIVRIGTTDGKRAGIGTLTTLSNEAPHIMMFTLDLSGHDADKKAGINRYGGLFLSIDDAVSYGHAAASKDRLHFRPEIIWVRNEEGEVVRRDVL